RLHLRRGDRHLVVDALERAAHDVERRQDLARLGARWAVDARAHLAQRAGEQAHGRARVSALERPGRGAQAVEPHAVHARLPVAQRVDAHAEIAERLHGAPVVLATGEAADLDGAVAERAEKDRAVPDRLVAGDADG